MGPHGLEMDSPKLAWCYIFDDPQILKTNEKPWNTRGLWYVSFFDSKFKPFKTVWARQN